MRKANFDFEIKKDDSGIYIEGFANAATVDRSNEIIDPKGWKLDNYKKNPVVLFDHGMDPQFGSLPIGKAIVVEPRDTGLFTKIKISDSKTEKITAIRDLVNEGILKTFSVGFKPGQIEDQGDSKRIKSSELLEISVVPIPMNQDSTFSILSKSLPENSSKLARRWLKRYQAEIQKKTIESSKKQLVCDKLELLAVHVEKKAYENLEKASKFLKENGYKVDDCFESDNLFIFKQKDLIDSIGYSTFDINLSPFIKVKVKGEKMPPENTEEETTTTEENPEDKGCGDKKPEKKEMSPEMVSMIDQYAAEAVACAEDTEGNPAAWASDEEAWKKAKAAADESNYRSDPEKYYALVTWLYLNKFGGTIKQHEAVPVDGEKNADGIEVKSEGAPIPTGFNAGSPDSNPMLDLAKQTNVLLGSLISEVQGLSKHMEKLVDKPMDDYTDVGENPPPSDTPPPVDESLQKSIDAIRRNQNELALRLKKFT